VTPPQSMVVGEPLPLSTAAAAMTHGSRPLVGGEAARGRRTTLPPTSGEVARDRSVVTHRRDKPGRGGVHDRQW
jgi:hypothetical protein